MRRRTAISWLLTTCMVLAMVPQGAVRASAAAIIVDLPDDPYTNAVVIVNMNMTGTGRANDPYIIYTPKGLQMIRQDRPINTMKVSDYAAAWIDNSDDGSVVLSGSGCPEFVSLGCHLRDDGREYSSGVVVWFGGLSF